MVDALAEPTHDRTGPPVTQRASAERAGFERVSKTSKTTGKRKPSTTRTTTTTRRKVRRDPDLVEGRQLADGSIDGSVGFYFRGECGWEE